MSVQGKKDSPAALNDEGVKRNYSVPAAEKTLDILEFMVGQPQGMTITELAGGLDRSVHEIYRVVQVLEARGYLYRPQKSDRYRLSLKLFELAHQVPSVRQMTDAAVPTMQALAPKTLQSCHLGVLNGSEVLIVLQIDSPLPMRYSVMLGAKFTFEETSLGLVIYAFSSQNVRRKLDEWLRAEGRSDEVIASVAERARAIVEAGCEVRPSLAVAGVTNVSAPVFDYLGHVVAAITTPYVPQLAATVPLAEVKRATIEAAGKISADLGYQNAANRGGDVVRLDR
jgi:DNA-binding IclR family transcriptional regulator